ncbi:MAG: efflux RND transporter periplasmic adaptor subunit [Candidatus Staskawiczbacteria bacterium]|jgi:HlyD family secretion protein
MKITKFLKKKRVVWTIIILLAVIAIGYFAFGGNNKTSGIQTATVAKQNLQETVLSTGQVVSRVDLSLSFQGSGVARQVFVKEGDEVAKGKILALLDQSSARASLMTAQGALAQAQANYDKVINGATPEDIQIYEDAVLSAQEDLRDTYNGSSNTLNDAYIYVYNAYRFVVLLQNNYFGASDQEGIRVQDNKNSINEKMADIRTAIDGATTNEKIDSAVSVIIGDLNSVQDSLRIIREQCDEGAYANKVSTADKTSLDTHKANIVAAITSINSLQHSIASDKIALQKAENTLTQKTVKPRQEDVDAAYAQVISAQGQVASAQATINNLTLWAPAGGTITHVGIKVGEQAAAMTEVMVLQNVSDVYAEANVSEANIASLEVGQTIDYTFDALGPDETFQGKILTINPASTVISGVVNYKVTGSLENIPDIKPGMTVNMTVLVAEKDNVLAVPSSAIINKDGKKYIRVIDDLKTKKYHEVEVQIGMQADGGLVEIISGLTEGQMIITYMK